MQIGFASQSVRRICEEPVPVLSESKRAPLRRFLADVDAAETAEELALLGVLSGQLSPERVVVTLSAQSSLICRFDHVPVQRHSDGTVRLDRIHRILIVEINEAEEQS